MTITLEQLVQWRKLTDEATADWVTESDGERVKNGNGDCVADGKLLGYDGYWRDMDFIAAARTAVPALLDGYESLRARVTELEAEAAYSNEAHHNAENQLIAANQRVEAAEADNGRLRATLEQIAHNEYTDNQIDETIQAALAASPAPETGEREAVAEALIEWAAVEQIDDGNFACIYCGRDWKPGKGCKHAPDCLHLRAKALRAQAGGEG